MRRIMLGLVAATFLSGNAFACMSPTNQEALEIAGLKSSLMVSALTCNQRSQYDAFMTRFQPFVLHEQHVMDAYFRQQHGRAFRHYEDSYVTDLANVQSTAGTYLGTNFCPASETLFSKVLSAKTQDELVAFARQNPALQPIVVLGCGIDTSDEFRAVESLVPRH